MQIGRYCDLKKLANRLTLTLDIIIQLLDDRSGIALQTKGFWVAVAAVVRDGSGRHWPRSMRLPLVYDCLGTAEQWIKLGKGAIK
jgi:hypothetical protein